MATFNRTDDHGNSRQLPVTGFVLVGGQSRRMGRDKALLELDGEPLFLRTAKLLKPYASDVVLLGPTERFSRFGLPVWDDVYPGRGPVGALYTALRNSHSDWNLFFACDLPFLNGSIVEILLLRVRNTTAHAVVPKVGERWQPLCAAYHRNCLSVIEPLILRADDLSLVGLLSKFPVEVVSPRQSQNAGEWENLFSNVNTAEEWEHAQRSAGPVRT